MTKPLPLSRYVAVLRKRLPAFGEARRARQWANRAFDDFVQTGGGRKQMLLDIADHALRLTGMARHLETDAAKRSFAQALLTVCAWIDSGQVRLADWKLRSYEDISIQVTSLRRLIDYLSGAVAFSGGSPALAALPNLVSTFAIGLASG